MGGYGSPISQTQSGVGTMMVIYVYTVCLVQCGENDNKTLQISLRVVQGHGAPY